MNNLNKILITTMIILIALLFLQVHHCNIVIDDLVKENHDIKIERNKITNKYIIETGKTP